MKQLRASWERPQAWARGRLEKEEQKGRAKRQRPGLLWPRQSHWNSEEPPQGQNQRTSKMKNQRRTQLTAETLTGGMPRPPEEHKAEKCCWRGSEVREAKGGGSYIVLGIMALPF